MEKLYLSIAGFIIEIVFYPSDFTYFKHSFKKEIYKLTKDFQIKSHPKKIDFRISIHEKEYAFLKKKSASSEFYLPIYLEEDRNKMKTFYYTSANMFIHVLNHALIKLMATSPGFWLHASAANFNGKAIIFLGPQEAGKSTVVTLLNGRFKALADDRVIIKREDNNFFLYQTPHFLKNVWIKRSSKKYPIKGMFFLKKAPFFKIIKISNLEEIIGLLTKQLLTDKEKSNKDLYDLLTFINNKKFFYFLYFAKNKKNLINFFENLNI